MKSNNQINNPEAREAMDKFKMEAAQEVGVDLKQGYNGPPDLPRGRLRRRPDGHEDDSRPTREACKQSLSRAKNPLPTGSGFLRKRRDEVRTAGAGGRTVENPFHLERQPVYSSILSGNASVRIMPHILSM